MIKQRPSFEVQVRFNFISIQWQESVVASNDCHLHLIQVHNRDFSFILNNLVVFLLFFTAANSVDIKARKRIEELFELTDEIINAYNEINEKYVSQIYRKYEQLKEANKKLKETLHRHHCAGCQCTTTESNANEEEKGEAEEEEEEEEESSSEEEEDDDSDDEQPTNSVLPSSTTNSIVTRSKKNNRSFNFIESSCIFFFFVF